MERRAGSQRGCGRVAARLSLTRVAAAVATSPFRSFVSRHFFLFSFRLLSFSPIDKDIAESSECTE